MQKTKTRSFLVALVIFSLVTMSGTLSVNAANMDTAKVTLGDSSPSATADTVVTFNLKNDGLASDKIKVDFNGEGFTGLTTGNVICPLAGTSTIVGDIVTCAGFSGPLASTTDYTMTIRTTNPGSTGDALINVIRTNSADAEQENTQTMVYIIESVSVTAHVDATLTFGISPVASGTTINLQTTNRESSTTTVPFGTLTPGTDVIVGQKLTVSTNASDGFTVTVQQDGEMVSAAGSNINSFNNATNGTGDVAPDVWAEPAGTLGNDWTYGHMGITTDDGTMTDLGKDYTGAKFAGLNGSDALPVMYHDGPAGGEIVGTGEANVIYRAKISALQEAGDYSSKLTYICTPTY